MGRNTAWGNNAYKETKQNGGSKEECKNAASIASDRYWEQTRQRQFGNCGNSSNDNSDFDSDANGNGTRWHDSDDL